MSASLRYRPVSQPPGQRAPDDHAHAVLLAGGQHRRLDAADEDRVGRLLAAEPHVTAPVRDPLRLDDLLGREGGGADRADLAAAHQVGQRGQGLVDVGVRVRAVHLVQVDVVGLQAAQAVLHLADDPAARVAAHVGVLAHRAVRLGGQHHLVAAAAQGLADDLLRLPRRVHVRGVDEVDAAVQRGVDDPDAVLVIGVAPRAEHHRAEAVRAHLDPGTAERPHPHARAPPWLALLRLLAPSRPVPIVLTVVPGPGARVLTEVQRPPNPLCCLGQVYS